MLDFNCSCYKTGSYSISISSINIGGVGVGGSVGEGSGGIGGGGGPPRAPVAETGQRTLCPPLIGPGCGDGGDSRNSSTDNQLLIVDI